MSVKSISASKGKKKKPHGRIWVTKRKKNQKRGRRKAGEWKKARARKKNNLNDHGPVATLFIAGKEDEQARQQRRAPRGNLVETSGVRNELVLVTSREGGREEAKARPKGYSKKRKKKHGVTPGTKRKGEKSGQHGPTERY